MLTYFQQGQKNKEQKAEVGVPKSSYSLASGQNYFPQRKIRATGKGD